VGENIFSGRTVIRKLVTGRNVREDVQIKGSRVWTETTGWGGEINVKQSRYRPGVAQRFPGS